MYLMWQVVTAISLILLIAITMTTVSKVSSSYDSLRCLISDRIPNDRKFDRALRRVMGDRNQYMEVPKAVLIALAEADEHDAYVCIKLLNDSLIKHKTVIREPGVEDAGYALFVMTKGLCTGEGVNTEEVTVLTKGSTWQTKNHS